MPPEPVISVPVPEFAKKPFTWSYSKLKNYETCPRRCLHYDLLRDVVQEESEELAWGNKVHAAMERRIGFGLPLQAGMEHFEDWAKRIQAVGDKGTLLVEQKLAINRAFGACGYFDKAVWFRSKADILALVGNVALTVDWKTGKRKDDSVQLALTAACVFAAYPKITAVRTEYIWLATEGFPSDRTDFKREDMAAFWNRMLPRVKPMEEAHLSPVPQSYPPKPSGLCRLYCEVRSCEHCGD